MWLKKTYVILGFTEVLCIKTEIMSHLYKALAQPQLEYGF